MHGREPSVAEIASVTSEPTTVVLEERQTENVSIAQAEDPSLAESSESVVPDVVQSGCYTPKFYCAQNLYLNHVYFPQLEHSRLHDHLGLASGFHAQGCSL